MRLRLQGLHMGVRRLRNFWGALEGSLDLISAKPQGVEHPNPGIHPKGYTWRFTGFKKQSYKYGFF